MTYTTYVLQSVTTGRLYVGSTEDFDRRLGEHQRGDAHYTHGRGPWQVVWREEFGTRSEAMRRERALKSGQGRAWLREQLGGRVGPPEAG
ncbi:MAG: GIY-YIG nuclease family protein [Chloroflexota bacterium]